MNERRRIGIVSAFDFYLLCGASNNQWHLAALCLLRHVYWFDFDSSAELPSLCVSVRDIAITKLLDVKYTVRRHRKEMRFTTHFLFVYREQIFEI